MSDDLAEWAVGNYRRAVQRSAQALRDTADRLERDALDVRPRRGGGLQYGDAAASAVHAMFWGVANAQVDSIVTAAAKADQFTTTEEKA